MVSLSGRTARSMRRVVMADTSGVPRDTIFGVHPANITEVPRNMRGFEQRWWRTRSEQEKVIFSGLSEKFRQTMP